MSTYQMSNVQTIELQETINIYQVRNEIYGGTLIDEKRIVEITKSPISGKYWERKPVFECDTDGCGVCRYKSDCKQTSLKLGNEISDDYTYRQMFFVYDKGEHTYDYTDSQIDGSVFSGSREECESWIETEKHKNNWVVSNCEYQTSTHFKKSGEKSRKLNDSILWGAGAVHIQILLWFF